MKAAHTHLTELLRETAIGCDHMNEFGLRDTCNEAAETISGLLGALEHILAGSLSLPRFAEAEAKAAIRKARGLSCDCGDSAMVGNECKSCGAVL